MKGQLVCRMHGGSTPQAKTATERRLALQAINADIESLGLGGTDVDPGETLLRLLTQARARVQVYAAEVARVFRASAWQPLALFVHVTNGASIRNDVQGRDVRGGVGPGRAVVPRDVPRS